MYRQIIGLLVSLALVMMTAGCNGSRETDQVSYVITMGVDAAPGNQLTITYRLAVPVALAAGETAGASKSKKSSTLITVTAPTLTEGRSLLNSATSRAVSLAHIKAIVIGEGLARRGLDDIVGAFARFREYRGSVYIQVTYGVTAREVMEKNEPEFEVLGSEWIENMFATFDETAYYLPSNLHTFYKRLKGESGAPYITVVGIDDLSGTGKPETEGVTGDKRREYLPGQMPRKGGNPVTMIGTAVFKDDKLAGFLTNGQTRALAMLLGKFPHGFISVTDPLVPDRPLSVNTRLGGKPKIDIDVSNDTPLINIDVFLEGEITNIPSGIIYEESNYKPLLENQISRVVTAQLAEMLNITQQLGTDVVNFGYQARPKFGTIEEFVNYHWNDKYSQAVVNIKVTTRLRRTGLMRKTTPLERE